MEKNTKFPQSSAKGVPADAKKNQDIINKLFPRSSRRRESAGTSNFSKSEQSRKCNVQKTKNFDKRPKPKGQYHGSSKEDTKVVQAELAEPGSVVVQGSKKQNLNHLLNFHYEPREMRGSGTWNHGKSIKGLTRNSNRCLPPVQRHKYNKEQFLQASCQFVVNANGNYTLYLSDPDVLVDWKLIEQIKLHSSENLSCPICLYPPVAGKITRCGHVYCWPCILHYLSLSDKPSRKCPICDESVQKSDLKSVNEVTQSTLNLGDTITLRLMRREKGSLLAVPVGSLIQNPTNFFPLSETISNQVYSKLLIASTEDVMNIIECERTQLKFELSDNPDSPENCYIEQALDELSKREGELLQRKRNFLQVKSEIPLNETSTLAYKLQIEKTDIEKHLSQSRSQDYEETNTSTKRNKNDVDEEILKSAENSSNGVQLTPDIPKFFYFYQAEDGQHLYLHAMNVKMLEMQYGSLENSPRVIMGKLLEKEGGSLTEDLRRRLRYLCHLPLTCQFEVAEIELKPPIVSEEVLSSFQDQLTLRHRHRQQRERDERKREKQITEEENKRMGRYPTPAVHIDSRRHFPRWQPESESVPSPLESTAASSVASSPSSNTFDEMVASRQTDNVAHEQGPSFAEMLRNTGTRLKSQTLWPSINSTHRKQYTSLTVQTPSRNTEEEDYVSVPSYSQNFGDALAAALQQTKLETEKNGGGKKKKKKKKGKSTVLFATTVAHES
ncbi:RING finger protein 10 isoform X2 [Bombus affinis]|uniref:E3 ubiquitin-protein ligase RNF10 n=1 Tax=Bombus terrestris TaxID=30195 RepID=A0A9B7CXD7_BOMTE|nr:RING finger protein 10 isoform X2 [Bombus terrestris]XP_050586267.1 RING finger protein 10 isoform X2 [Bombus affinis]